MQTQIKIMENKENQSMTNLQYSRINQISKDVC